MFDLTPAHIHLAVNHLPVVGALLATATLGLAAITRRASTRNLGFSLLIFAALSALPAYISGEGAEEMVEHRPWVLEALIERHEDAAARALVVTLAAGVVAAFGFLAVRLRQERAVQTLFAVALLSSIVATGLMGQVANLGGQIRHDEIRSQTAMRYAARATHAKRNCETTMTERFAAMHAAARGGCRIWETPVFSPIARSSRWKKRTTSSTANRSG